MPKALSRKLKKKKNWKENKFMTASLGTSERYLERSHGYRIMVKTNILARVKA